MQKSNKYNLLIPILPVLAPLTAAVSLVVLGVMGIVIVVVGIGMALFNVAKNLHHILLFPLWPVRIVMGLLFLPALWVLFLLQDEHKSESLYNLRDHIHKIIDLLWPRTWASANW